ncbi:hypothetical protein [Helicobacter sp. T3_23-1056]
MRGVSRSKNPSAREGVFNPPRKSSLREFTTLLKVADSWQSTKEFCHTERSEVSQNIYSSLRAQLVARGNPLFFIAIIFNVIASN